MSKLKVQCKGSGQQPRSSQGYKRGTCPSCHRQQDLTGAGKIRRHDRLTTTARLRKMR